MQRPDWRELITDDCKLVFDLDLPCYNAAAANEDKIFKVFLKETGEEFFKEKDVELFETVCINPETLGAFYNGNEETIYEKRSTGKFIICAAKTNAPITPIIGILRSSRSLPSRFATVPTTAAETTYAQPHTGAVKKPSGICIATFLFIEADHGRCSPRPSCRISRLWYR